MSAPIDDSADSALDVALRAVRDADKTGMDPTRAFAAGATFGLLAQTVDSELALGLEHVDNSVLWQESLENVARDYAAFLYEVFAVRDPGFVKKLLALEAQLAVYARRAGVDFLREVNDAMDERHLDACPHRDEPAEARS